MPITRLFLPILFVELGLGMLVSGASGAGVVGPRLRYLEHMVESGRVARPPIIAVTLVVDHDFALGSLPSDVEFRRGLNLDVLRTRRVVPLLSSLATAANLRALPGVVQVETDWFPRASVPPLDLSRIEVGAEEVWPAADAAALPLVGSGVVIADLDSGVDVFHPHFFHPDGGRFAWLDVDLSGDFSAGVDAVDLDGDRVADPDEPLGVFETPIAGSFPRPNPAGYDLDLDWLYADLDRDSIRDRGRANGFDDRSPAFGEPLLFLDDRDSDGVIDPGEELIGLGTSKIRVVRERAGLIRRRGVDLIDAESDASLPHGSWVSGILLGGVAGVSRMAGMAPGAELIMANMYYPSVPPFEDDMASLALWARSEGARVTLYESGNWVWAYLDGSHSAEIAMSDMADEGYLQVTPNGNLGGGGQSATRMLTATVTTDLSFTTPAGRGVQVVWPSLLWRSDPSQATVEVVLPGSVTFSPCYCASTEVSGGFSIYSDRTQSSRGTTMLNYEIRKDGGGDVSGTFRLRVTPSQDLKVHGYSWDDRSGWSGETRWDTPDDLHIVTQPATADRSIAVAAYSPRNCGGCTPAGQLNGFSGRGQRIDGVSVVDITAPGSRVYSTAPSASGGFGAITSFGGTSSALPHVTGAAALLVQLNPNDSHDVIERMLRESALTDSFTGPVPNDSWGMGKLRIRDAYVIASRPSLLRDDAITLLNPRPDVSARFPGVGSTTLALAGVNGYSREGEGGPLNQPGSLDGDAFLAAHVLPGLIDPEGVAVIGDTGRPLVFYQLAGGATLKLAKSASGIVVSY